MLTGSCHCGQARWTLEGAPGPITVCNCTACRRHATLWAYDYEGERIEVEGASRAYVRADEAEPTLETHFCPTCGNVLWWRAVRRESDGRRRMAVNVRLAPPETVGDLSIKLFDGLDTFDELASDGRCVRDFWV